MPHWKAIEREKELYYKNIAMRKHKIFIGFLTGSFLLLQSCSTQKKLSRQPDDILLRDSALATAHIGISIYDPATDKYLYNYQADKYFVPASNTKIPTCYLGMKYLGDSLTGLLYGIPEETRFKDKIVAIRPTGDPTFFHLDFKQQPVFDFLRTTFKEKQKTPATFYNDGSNVERWGNGWSWNDYQSYYMAERNTFPIFGNVATVQMLAVANREVSDTLRPYTSAVKLFETGNAWLNRMVNNTTDPPAEWTSDSLPKISLKRDISSNKFNTGSSSTSFATTEIPFVTNYTNTTTAILEDTLHIPFQYYLEKSNVSQKFDLLYKPYTSRESVTIKQWHPIHSQPTDSMLQRMMYRSDNFYAEQTLLMSSFALLDKMDHRKMIDTILKTDLKELPQKPAWADGSGLSRYNLFTPQDFVHILQKMKTEFGMERIKGIFPTGGKGTLSSYYNDAQEPYLFAKTGTLSGVVALSGFIYTKSGKELIFSVLVNNHQTSAVHVRRTVETFLKEIRNNY